MRLAASMATSLEEGRRFLKELMAQEALGAVDPAGGATDALLVRARAATILQRYDQAYQLVGALAFPEQRKCYLLHPGW